VVRARRAQAGPQHRCGHATQINHGSFKLPLSPPLPRGAHQEPLGIGPGEPRKTQSRLPAHGGLNARGGSESAAHLENKMRTDSLAKKGII
jgi:hypothetical protein